jgi:LmbE family N-acetylglucosaminyl deacetylase
VTSVVAAVSPHLDDLALSCAGLLAAHPASTMVTAFAGGPPSVDPVTAWEELSGIFDPGADIVGARRGEDVLASVELEANFRHLDHWDHQYRNATYGFQGAAEPSALIRAVAQDLESLVAASPAATWAVPLGLAHPDHEVTAAACLEVAANHPEVDWLVYEELPYAVYLPGKVLDAEVRLRSRGFGLQPVEGVEVSADPSRKRRAVSCYRSQLQPLGEAIGVALDTPERLHRLTRSRS